MLTCPSVQIPTHINIMLYGESGLGKTVSVSACILRRKSTHHHRRCCWHMLYHKRCSPQQLCSGAAGMVSLVPYEVVPYGSLRRCGHWALGFVARWTTTQAEV